MSRQQGERKTTDIGYINFSYDRQKKTWNIGGNFTDEKGEEWDLLYAKTGTAGLQEGIATVAKQLQPTLAGKGIKRERRESTGSGNNNGNGGGGGGGY